MKIRSVFKAHYKKPLAVVLLPLFLLWYIWTKLERSTPVRIAASACVILLCVTTVSATAAMLPSKTSDSTQSEQVQEANAAEPTQTTDNQQHVSAQDSQNYNQQKPAQKQSASSSMATSADTANNPSQQEPVKPAYNDTYPADWKQHCNGMDMWGMDKCQSVSYTAWKVSETFGNMSKWGPIWPAGLIGHAKNWLVLAENENIPTGTTPKVHSVAVSTLGPLGFTAWVEAIDGNSMTLSSYNWNYGKSYHLHENVQLPAAQFSGYIYFGN